MCLVAPVPPVPTEGARYVAVLESPDDKRAAGIIRGLYAFVRNETPEREMLHLPAVVSEMLEVLNFELLKNNVEVHTEFSDICPLMGNKAQLQQVFLNLLTNAIDAMKGGPVVPRVKIAIRQADDHAIAS